MTSPAPSTDGTIFALSSGALPAAIAIVRISGPAAGDALRRLTGNLPPPRRAVSRRLHDSAGGLLDRGLVLWMPGPATATGEDIAELHVHGGRAVVAAVMQELSHVRTCRLAQPGEFTRRAFLNGRIDLTAAEGLADLLAAETEHQRRAATWAAEGGLSRRIGDWMDRLRGIAAAIEADIEFAEEEPDAASDMVRHQAAVEALRREVTMLLASPPAERLRDGVRVLIAGPPNAGKSTLLNALVGREAAIATPMAGTTRDLIEAPIVIEGVPFVVTDSAGLHDAAVGPVERIGIARTVDAISGADILLWLGAPGDRPDHPKTIMLASKSDARAEPPPADAHPISAISGMGMVELRSMLLDDARSLLPTHDGVTLNLRQRDALAEAADVLLVTEVDDPVLLAEHLRLARCAMSTVTGGSGVEEMLDALFASFCIGK